MSMAFMDSMATGQTLGLQQMRREAAIESAPKALLLQRQRESFVFLGTSKLLLTGRLVPFTRRMGLSSTIPCQEAITNQAKPNPSSSSSSRKPRAKSGKNKTKSQETPTN